MTEKNHRARVVDDVTDKVMSKPSVQAEESEIRSRAEESVDQLLDEPVQTFTSLLAENDVVTELHESTRAEQG